MKRAAETHHELQTRRQRYERLLEDQLRTRWDLFLERKKIWGPGTVLCYQLREPESLISQCWRVLQSGRAPNKDLFLMVNFYDLGELSSREQKRFGSRSRMRQYVRNVTCVPFEGVFHKYDLDDIFVPVLITPERFRDLFGYGYGDHHRVTWSLYNAPPPKASEHCGGYAVFL